MGKSNYNFKKLHPFKWFILQNYPFLEDSIDVLTNYQLFCKLGEMINNQVAPINEMGEQVENLTNAFNELYDWFENLDVQDEINNKLDEMAEDGTLENILLNYTTTEKVYNTYEDMIQDLTNHPGHMKNNMKIKTLGYYAINDGGNADYIISDTSSGYYIELNDLYIILLNDSVNVNPLQFGCKGDNTTDDTVNLKNALKYAIDNNKKLIINKKFYITAPLLNENDYNSVNLNISGINTSKWDYSLDNAICGITLNNSINMFENITIQGLIENICITQKTRQNSGSIFSNCIISQFQFKNNVVSNIGTFLLNTSVNNISKFINNRFLTVYYFSKGNGQTFVDSIISENYINGGQELYNNDCFQFISYNGSVISNNFIDFYRTIYAPSNSAAFGFQGPTSIGNNYQVFKYLYIKGNARYFYFDSTSDSFNHTDPANTTYPHLADYQSLTYIGHDSQVHNLPEFIGMVVDGQISFKNVNLQRNLSSNIIFIQNDGITNYVTNKFEFNVATNNNNSLKYTLTKPDAIYNNGANKRNLIQVDKRFFYDNKDSIPSVANWSNYILGEYITVSNVLYQLVYDYENTQFSWVKVY